MSPEVAGAENKGIKEVLRQQLCSILTKKRIHYWSESALHHLHLPPSDSHDLDRGQLHADPALLFRHQRHQSCFHQEPLSLSSWSTRHTCTHPQGHLGWVVLGIQMQSGVKLLTFLSSCLLLGHQRATNHRTPVQHRDVWARYCRSRVCPLLERLY